MIVGGRVAYADPFYSNYLAGNAHSTVAVQCIAKASSICPNQDIAVAFTVPSNPQINYKLNTIELTLKDVSSNGQLTVYLLNDDPANPGHPDPNFNFIESINMNGKMVSNQFTFLMAQSSTGIGPTLQAGKTYWLVPSIAQNNSASVLWPDNVAGVTTKTATRANQFSPWVVSNNPAPVFRIIGTPTTAQPVKASYSSYTAPPGGGLATVYLEVVCPNPLSNPFTMPVSVQLPGTGTQTPAQVCQLLANAINNCSGCPCWGGAACPSSAPYGFQADCGGSVLRVTNSTPGLCPGAFVCADHVDGLTKYAAKKQLEGLSGAIALEIRGVATGVARDPAASIDVNVARMLRSGADSPPQVFQGQVVLTRGMESSRVLRSLAEAFSTQGDTGVVVEGNRVIFSPPGRLGNFNNANVAADYDIAFQVNDTGLEYAFSPPFNYSFFDYVARFAPAPPPAPTFPKWGWIILILALVLLGVIVLLRWKKKA